MDIFFVGAAIFGFMSNSLTSIYIFQTFNIRVHVFALLFVDAFFSAICCAVSSTIDLLVMFDFMKLEYIYCNISYVAIYYSSCFGAFLTFLIASIRYYLSIHSMHIVQPGKVSKFTFSFFSFVVLSNVVFVAVNAGLDIPYALLVEGCTYRIREARYVRLEHFQTYFLHFCYWTLFSQSNIKILHFNFLLIDNL